MGNCTKIKFNGQYNDGGLPKFNEYVLGVHNLDSPDANAKSLTLKASSTITVTTDGDGVMEGAEYGGVRYSNVTSLDIPANTDAYISLSNGNYNVHVLGKYTLLKVLNDCNTSHIKCLFRVNLSDLEYCTELEYIKGAYNCEGDILSLSRLIALQNLNLRNSNVTGAIESLSSCIALTTLMLQEAQGVYGTLEGLAGGMVANGRTSGTLSVNVYGCGVTYNGEVIGVVTVTFDPLAPNGYIVN